MLLKNRITGLIACIFIIQAALPDGLNAQIYSQTEIQISKDKVRASDGTVCYSHFVQEKQTLYSICKAYGVKTEDVVAVNPYLKTESLRKGSILLIPADAVRTDSQEKEESPVIQKIEESVEEGIVHIVKWYEDIESIAKEYAVSAEEILSFNGIKKIKKRMSLRIPPKGGIVTAPEDSTDLQAGEDEGIIAQEEERRGLGRLFDFLSPKNEVDAVLLLPIGKGAQANKNYLDFYSGALMAVKELGDNEGISTKLKIFDITDANFSYAPAQLSQADFILGPVSPEDITKVLEIVPDNIPVISPLNQNVSALAAKHVNLIQAPASYYSQYKDIVNWIGSDMKDSDKLIVISESGKSSSATAAIDSLLLQSGLNFTPFSYSILQGRNIINSLRGVMTTEGINRILVKSENESFVYDLIRNLNLLLYEEIAVEMYAPNRIRSFGTIDPIDLHNVNLHSSLSYFIDYDSRRCSDFLMNYRALFQTEPSQFAFQGYDLCRYFIMKSREKGSWAERLEKREQMIQSDLDFQQAEDAGYINQGVRRVIYEKNFKIRLVR